jgi:hypothetical protein
MSWLLAELANGTGLVGAAQIEASIQAHLAQTI